MANSSNSSVDNSIATGTVQKWDEAKATALAPTGSVLTGGLFHIGRPLNFDTNIDKNHRIGKYLKSKMNVIDLVPCSHTVDFDKLVNDKDISGLIPKLDYNAPVKRFKDNCTLYGVQDHFVGIRLYTTDDTTTADSITNQYGENVLSSKINSMSQQFSNIREFLKSTMGERGKEVIAKGREAASEGIGGIAGGIAAMVGGDPDLQNKINKSMTNVSNAALDVILDGSRVQLPQIWGNSDYDPTMSVMVKLVSPYGHPNAIKEFIIRPLIYLLLLGTPSTINGVAYNMPQQLTIDAPGINFTSLGAIETINLRRGGNDTSFNLFRQPLSVDVSITFKYLIQGFAHFDGANTKDTPSVEENAFKDSAKDVSKDYDVHKATLTTVGKLIRSFRPMKPQEIELFKTLDPSPSVANTSSNVDMSRQRSTIQDAKETVEDTSGYNIAGDNRDRIDSEARG